MEKVHIESQERIFDDFFKIDEAHLRFERFDGQWSDTVRRLNEGRLDRGRKYVDLIGSQLSSAGAKVESQDAIKEGDASQNIVDHVKDHQINLVVMSTHGHGGVRRLLMGSVTDRVIRSCEAPVLVVPCS